MTHDNFPVGSIVCINGYDLDYGKFKQKKNAPMFYGVVADPDHNSGKLKDDELLVTFVISEEYKWYNRNVPNALVSNYKKRYLVQCHLPPVNINSSNDITVSDVSTR